jgi:hypothetical protein
VRRLVAIVSVLAMLAWASTEGARADEPAVVLGEVTAQAAKRDDVDLGALRAAAEDAVKSLDEAHLPKGTHVVLSVSVVRLESRASDAAEVTCVVSATLRDRARGSVFAVVEGTARGQDAPKRLRELERAILHAALRSAVARVPEAVKRRRR